MSTGRTRVASSQSHGTQNLPKKLATRRNLMADEQFGPKLEPKKTCDTASLVTSPMLPKPCRIVSQLSVKTACVCVRPSHSLGMFVPPYRRDNPSQRFRTRTTLRQTSYPPKVSRPVGRNSPGDRSVPSDRIDPGTEETGLTNPTRQRGPLAVASPGCPAGPLAGASGWYGYDCGPGSLFLAGRLNQAIQTAGSRLDQRPRSVVPPAAVY